MTAAHSKGILFIGVFFTSLSAIFARYSDAPALIISLYRLGWTVLLLLPSALGGVHRRELRSLSRRDLGLCLLSGAFLALHFFLWFEALRHTSIASATVLVSTEVIFAALGFSLLLRGHLPSMAVAAIVMTMAGSGLIAMGGEGSPNLYGNLLALGAAAAAAAYTLIGRALRSRVSTTSYTFLVYLGCALCLLATTLVSRNPILGYQPKELLIALALCVLCTLLGHSVFSWCLRYLTPSFVAAVKLAGPIYAAVLALCLFGEAPHFIEVAGGLIILGGLLLYCRVEQAEAELDGLPAMADQGE